MSAASKAVLLVDSADQSRRFLELGFRKAGLQVTAVASESAALSAAASMSSAVVVIDSGLSDGSAISLLRALRNGSSTAAWPVAVVLDAADTEARGRFTEAGADELMTRPVKVKEAAARLRTLTDRPVAAVSTTLGVLDGTLDESELFDLVNTVIEERRTGAARLMSGNLNGTVYFHEGRVVDAVSGRTQGQEAFNRMFTWSTGTWSVVYTNGSDRPARITLSTDELLAAAVSYNELWETAAARLASVDTVYTVEYRSFVGRLGSMPEEANIVVRVFDGIRTVREAVAACELDDLAALRVVPLLLDAGVLSAVGQGGATSNDGAEFERLRTTAQNPTVSAAEVARLSEETRRKAEEEGARIAEAARAQAEAESARAAEEAARAAAEAEARRQAEDERRRVDEEARRVAEDAARVAREQYEAMVSRAREAEEAARAAEEAARQVREEQARQRAAEEAARIAAEEARLRAQQEVERQLAEEELLRLESERQELDEARRREMEDAELRAANVRREAEMLADNLRREAEQRSSALSERERELDRRRVQLTGRLTAIQTGSMQAVAPTTLEEARLAEIAAMAQDAGIAASVAGDAPSARTPELSAEIELELAAMRGERDAANGATPLVSPVWELNQSREATGDSTLAAAPVAAAPEDSFFRDPANVTDDHELFAEPERSGAGPVLWGIAALAVLAAIIFFATQSSRTPPPAPVPTPEVEAPVAEASAPAAEASAPVAVEVPALPDPEAERIAMEIAMEGSGARAATGVLYHAQEIADDSWGFEEAPSAEELEEVAQDSRRLVDDDEEGAPRRTPRDTEPGTEERAPTSREARRALDQCANAARSGVYADAIRLCQEAVRANPDSATALVYLGTAHHELGENERAVQFLNNALRIDRNNGQGLVMAGTAYQAMGNIERAREFYQRYIAGNPDTRQAEELRRVLESL
jgi:CheY-like chemotaxis protein